VRRARARARDPSVLVCGARSEARAWLVHAKARARLVTLNRYIHHQDAE